MCVSPLGDINVSTPDIRVEVGNRAANCLVLRCMRRSPVSPMAPATFSAVKKRREIRRATRGVAQQLDDRHLYGKEYSFVHVDDWEEE